MSFPMSKDISVGLREFCIALGCLRMDTSALVPRLSLKLTTTVAFCVSDVMEPCSNTEPLDGIVM